MKIFIPLFFLAFSFSFQAQNNKKEVLFTIDEDPVYVSEFIRVFNKNLDLVKDASQKEVDTYLGLFVNYKLKLKEAKTLGYDTIAKYKSELANYKRQLAKNYVTDSKVTDALVEEAYERVSNEVNANHILIRLESHASPKDTLAVYNNLLTLRDSVLKEGFETVQKKVHDGKTVYAEALGYFSGFKMVYPFENVAFNTPVNKVSLPFRTQFGYHIIQVLDQRKSRGQREVAHIMVALKNENAESRIHDIYKKLQQGEAFEALAKQFSEDKSSASKGGILAPFSAGELRSKAFEDQSFSLNNEATYTQPFKTDFGWHIVKLIKKIETPPFQDMKASLETKVKRDSRSKRISDSRLSKLKERYTISNVDADLAYFTSILNTDYYNEKWKVPLHFQPQKAFVKIEDKQFTYKDFVDFLTKNQQRVAKQSSFTEIINEAYNNFLETKLFAYQEANLEFENEDFSNIFNEYRDGLLLFDLMDKEIWKAATEDTIGVQEFFKAKKEDYFFKERVDAVVASSVKKKDLIKVSKLLKNGLTIEEIKKVVNTNNKINVIFTTGLMDKDHQALPKGFSFKKGISKVYNNKDAYLVVKVNQILPKTLKTFEEAKGQVSSDFQDAKEENWLKQLASKYKVTINEDVLKTVKLKLTP